MADAARDRVAVVTGGGRGLGRGVAVALAVARPPGRGRRPERGRSWPRPRACIAAAGGRMISRPGRRQRPGRRGGPGDVRARRRSGAPIDPGQRGRGVRADRASSATPTRTPGSQTVMIDAIAPYLTESRVPGRDDRRGLGTHRQHHLGRVAPSARTAQQRLRHVQGGPQPAHPAPGGGDRRAPA